MHQTKTGIGAQAASHHAAGVMRAVAAAALVGAVLCTRCDARGQAVAAEIQKHAGFTVIRWPGHEGRTCEIGFGKRDGVPILRSIGIDIDRDGELHDRERLNLDALISFRAVQGDVALRAGFDGTAWEISKRGRGVQVRRGGLRLGPLQGEVEYRILPGSNVVSCLLRLTSSDRCELTRLEHRLTFATTAGIGRVLARKKEDAFRSTDEAKRSSRDMLTRPFASALHGKSVVVEGHGGVALALAMPPHYWFQGYPTAIDAPGTAGSVGMVLFDSKWCQEARIVFEPGVAKRLICLYYVGLDGAKTYQRMRRFFRNGRYVPLDGFRVFSTHNHGTAARMKKLERIGVNLALWNNYGYLLTPDVWQGQLEALPGLSGDAFRVIPSAESSDVPGPDGKYHGRLHKHTNHLTPAPLLLRGTQRNEAGQFVPVPGQEGALARARLAAAGNGLAWINHPVRDGVQELVREWTEDLFALEWNTYGDVHKYNSWNRFHPRFERPFFDRYEALLNAGRKIYIIAGTDDHNMTYIHAQGVVNYVRMEGLSTSVLIESLSRGDFFVTTGEILINRCELAGVPAGATLQMGAGGSARLKLELKWTYPLREIRVVSNRGPEVEHRPTEHREFGEGAFEFPIELDGRQWVRVEVWDVANNAAFTQPVFLAAGKGPGTVEGRASVPGTAAPGGWNLAFSDDFERQVPGADWKARGGTWDIQQGRLVGSGIMLCTWRFPGPQRIEYEARSRELSPVGDHQVCDLSAVLATWDGVKDGYFFGFGSDDNTRSKLLVRGGEVAEADKRVSLFKNYQVACEYDGKRLTHTVNGQVMQSYELDPQERLDGTGHDRVGLYLSLPGQIDNVRVYTRSGKAIAPAKKVVRLGAPPDTALIQNGSFERTRPGARPPVPTHWLAEGWTRDDRVELVTDAETAHRGRRFVRLSGPGEHGIRMHSVRSDGSRKKLRPGTRYVIRLWARRASAEPALLRVQPGDLEVRPERQWQMYSVSHAHPKSAGPETGMFFEVLGGPVDVDDVSMAVAGEGEPVPPDLRSDWRALKVISAGATWRHQVDGPPCRERVPVVVRETFGRAVRGQAVSIPLKEIFPSYKHDFVSPATVRVVDSSRPDDPNVPWCLVARYPARRTDMYHATGEDLLVFVADCPPMSQKTYHIYVADRSKPAGPFELLDRVADHLDVESDDPGSLSVEVGDGEPVLGVSAKWVEGRVESEVRAATGGKVAAELVGPEGRVGPVVSIRPSGPGRWTGSTRMPDHAPHGVWQVRAHATDRTGETLHTAATFTVGDAIWCETNNRRVYVDDPPRYGRASVEIAAAANEWESFQAVLAPAGTHRGVRLRPTDLTRMDGAGRIGADRITIEFVAHSFVFANARLRSGLAPGPLLPWTQVDIESGDRAVAWVTVRVPSGTPAGLYRGSLLAESRDGLNARLPIKLEVFDFTLPAALTFTPLIGGGLTPSKVQANRPPNWQENNQSRKHFSYLRANTFSVLTDQRRTMLDLYRYFGERRITPTGVGLLSIYGRDRPMGTYDGATKTLDLDLSLLDEIITAIEREDLDIKFLIHKGGERVRGGLERSYPGGVRFYDAASGQVIPGDHGTEQGYPLIRLWLEAIRDHLRPKGWSDRVMFYTCDEDMVRPTKYGPTNDLIVKFNDLIHEVAPEFRTFLADSARTRWYTALDGTDFFTGLMGKSNLERFRAAGHTWWGIYNRRLDITDPLDNGRIAALHCWTRGWRYQWQYHSTHWNEGFWFNPCLLSYYPANAGYPDGYFVSAAQSPGFYMIYPWPSRRGPEWRPDWPAFSGSIHVEAIRESAEDYEYLVMLEALAEADKNGGDQARECRALLDRVRTFVKDCNQGDDHAYLGARATFLIDGDQLQQLRRLMGHTISKWRGAS